MKYKCHQITWPNCSDIFQTAVITLFIGLHKISGQLFLDDFFFFLFVHSNTKDKVRNVLLCYVLCSTSAYNTKGSVIQDDYSKLKDTYKFQRNKY